MSALSQLSSQIGQGSYTHGSPSSSGSQSATPSPSSSAQEEEAKYHAKVQEVELFSCKVDVWRSDLVSCDCRLERNGDFQNIFQRVRNFFICKVLFVKNKENKEK